MAVSYVNKKGDILQNTGATCVITSTTGDESDIANVPATAAGPDGKEIPVTGLMLGGISAYNIFVKATSGTFSAGVLQAYLFDPIALEWARCPDLDKTVSEGSKQAYVPVQNHCRQGWLVFMPSGLNQPCTITLAGHYVRI